MHIFSKQTSIFLLLVSLIVPLFASASGAVLQKAKTNKLMVLNTVMQPAWVVQLNEWQESCTASPTWRACDRIATGALGAGECGLGVAGYFMGPMYIFLYDSPHHRLSSSVFFAGYYGLQFIGYRLCFGGILNVYNALAPIKYQLVIGKTKRRILGIAELIVAGLCTIGTADLWKRDVRWLGLLPGCWGMGLLGLYDLALSTEPMRGGFSILRF